MLILTRKSRQQIVVGDDFVISVLRITGNSVRLGIEAPESVGIIRAELKPICDATRAEVKSDRLANPLA